MPASQETLRSAHRRGFTLMEALLASAILLIGILSVTVPFASAARNERADSQQTLAVGLAHEMMEEVLGKRFYDSEPNARTGPEPGETRFTTPQFDNVNDYQGYSMTGIVDITNSAVTGLAGYSASVVVAPAALGSIGAGSGDALRVTVSVTGPGATTISLDGYRTRYAPNATL